MLTLPDNLQMAKKRILCLKTKWLRKTREIKPGDVVLLAGDPMPREKWPLGVIGECERSHDGLVRTVRIRTSGGIIRRDIRKICLLEGRE